MEETKISVSVETIGKMKILINEIVTPSVRFPVIDLVGEHIEDYVLKEALRESQNKAIQLRGMLEQILLSNRI